MRGIVRLGAIGVLIGLMSMVAAPTNARAMTLIDLLDQIQKFPDSVVGPPAVPSSGLLLAFHRGGTPSVETVPYETTEEGLQAINGFGGSSSVPFGLIVAFGDKTGLEILAVLPSNNSNGLAGATEETEEGTTEPTVNGTYEVASSTGSSSTGPSSSAPESESVSSAPEPATWIMMIFGFWIVAWRLRQRSQRAPEMGLACA